MYLQQFREITKIPDKMARLAFVDTSKIDEMLTIYLAKWGQVHVAFVDEKP